MVLTLQNIILNVHLSTKKIITCKKEISIIHKKEINQATDTVHEKIQILDFKRYYSILKKQKKIMFLKAPIFIKKVK